MPAVIGFVGILCGGLWSLALQRRQSKASVEQQNQQANTSIDLQRRQLEVTERTSRASAAYESLSKVMDYRSRQVNEFYYPLRLMLSRSAGVRRQLCDQLQAKAPLRFKFMEDGGKRRLYAMEVGGASSRFRLIEHMYELATKHAELLPLVKEIVSIGESMSKLIHDKGGLAVVESDELAELLGRYLAHFSILRDVHHKAEKSPEILAEIKYNVAYPIKFDECLDADLRKLNDEIDQWTLLSKQLWNDAMAAGPKSMDQVS